VLATLMLDFYRDSVHAGSDRASSDRRVDLLGALRARGFARGDTEQMRLILEAFQNLAAPTRRTRRLMRRPYFPDARMFFEMTAPTYSIDSTRMIRFLTDPDAFNAGPVRGSADAQPPAGDGAQPPAGGSRRRRRRRRRRHHRGAAPASAANGAAAPLQSPDPARRD
jgi:hypothetical protein